MEGTLCWNFVRHWRRCRHTSTTCMIRLPAIQLATPPTNVPMPSIHLLESDVLPWRLATNPDHLGIQKPVRLLGPDSPSRTGCTLSREAWAPPGRIFARTLPRHGPPATLDFGSHAFERQCKVYYEPIQHPFTIRLRCDRCEWSCCC